MATAKYMRIKVGGTILPSPTSVNITDELIWSSSTGRSSETGEMMGSVKATKKTLVVEWQWLTSSQWITIRDALPEGFFSSVRYENTEEEAAVTMDKAYRSNFDREDGGYVGSTHYYKSIKVSIIEK